MHSWSHSLKRAALVAVAIFAFFAPASAGAATVINGDFETGTLAGWQQFNQTGAGEWFAESREEAELEGFFPPPSGNFAAADFQMGEDLSVLFQDVPLEPGFTHHLALTLYYESTREITVPVPNTLSLDVDNQQLRVDVMRPSAPINSVNPSDILTTVFANNNGDLEAMPPTQLTADLSPFAGQTVRLRIANAVTLEPFHSGLDAVSITSAPLPSLPPPSNAIVRGKLTLSKKKGTGKLAINVPGPGILTAVAKGKTKRIRNANLTVTGAGTVKVPLNPNGAGKKVLNNKGKLKAQIGVTFTPTGGSANTQTYKVTLKKTLPKKQD
jgi:hypothetical protein